MASQTGRPSTPRSSTARPTTPRPSTPRPSTPSTLSTAPTTAPTTAPPTASINPAANPRTSLPPRPNSGYGNAYGNGYSSESDSDGQAQGNRRWPTAQYQSTLPLPPLPAGSGLLQPAGQLLKGAVDENGNPKNAALLIGIKLDLEAEVHLTARVRGDIVIGLY